MDCSVKNNFYTHVSTQTVEVLSLFHNSSLGVQQMLEWSVCRQRCTDVQTRRPAVKADIQVSSETQSALWTAQWTSSGKGTHRLFNDRNKNKTWTGSDYWSFTALSAAGSSLVHTSAVSKMWAMQHTLSLYWCLSGGGTDFGQWGQGEHHMTAHCMTRSEESGNVRSCATESEKKAKETFKYT